MLERSVGGLFLEDYNKVYDMGTRLLEEAKRHIRATSFSPYQHQAPQSYRDTLARVLQQSKKIGKPIRYDLVIGTDLDHSLAQAYKKANLRYDLFNQKGINDLTQIYVIDLSFGMDILIVDDRHVLVNFPGLRNIKELKFGLIFIDKPRVAKEVSIWFDEFLIRQSMPYQQFLEKYPFN